MFITELVDCSGVKLDCIILGGVSNIVSFTNMSGAEY